MNIKKILIGMTLFSSVLSVSAQIPIDTGSSAATADDAVRLIREDRMWEYFRAIGDPFNNDIIQFKFDGTEVVNGIEYHLLKAHKHLRINKELHECQDLIAIGLSEYPTIRMREVDGVIYRLYDDICTEEKNIETVVMDFNKSVGEKVNVPINPVEWNPLPEFINTGDEIYNMEVISTDIQSIDGENCRVLTMRLDQDHGSSGFLPRAYYKIVEGLGPVYVDNPLCQQGTIAMLESWEIITTFSCTEHRLNCVYDGDDNIIYRSETYYDWYADSVGWTGVEQVDDSMEDIRYYDMQGHRILNPTGLEKILKKSPDGKSVIVISGN